MAQEEAEAHAQGNKVQAISIAGVGWPGPGLGELRAPQGLGRAVYVPPRPPAAQAGYFSPAQFPWEEGGEQVRCPGGQTTAVRVRTARATGWTFRCARALCARCPLGAQCLPAWPPATGRPGIKHDYQADSEAARHRAQTQRYAAVRRLHPRVERKLADRVRDQGGRRCRGRWRVRIQYLLFGRVVNIKRMVKLLSPAWAEPVGQAA